MKSDFILTLIIIALALFFLLPLSPVKRSGNRACTSVKGAKEMPVKNVDDKNFLARLFNAMYDELPAPKEKIKLLKGEI